MGDTASDDLQQRLDELEALSSIFPDSVEVLGDDGAALDAKVATADGKFTARCDIVYYGCVLYIRNIDRWC